MEKEIKAKDIMYQNKKKFKLVIGLSKPIRKKKIEELLNESRSKSS